MKKPIINLYLDAILKLAHNREVPYYLESKIVDLCPILTTKDYGKIIDYVLSFHAPSILFRYLHRKKILRTICLPLHVLKAVPQNKSTKNAFEHTLKVIDVIPEEERIMRWVALFHDLGKYKSFRYDGNFNKHSIYSEEIASSLIDIYDLYNGKKVDDRHLKQRTLSIIKNHMIPLDYQRNPNWSDTAIKNMVDRVGANYILDVIKFAHYDKVSENNNEEYLVPLNELKHKVMTILK